MLVDKHSTSAAACPAAIRALDARLDQFLDSMNACIDQIHAHMDASALEEANIHRKAIAVASFLTGVLGTLVVFLIARQL